MRTEDVIVWSVITGFVGGSGASLVTSAVQERQESTVQVVQDWTKRSVDG